MRVKLLPGSGRGGAPFERVLRGGGRCRCVAEGRLLACRGGDPQCDSDYESSGSFFIEHRALVRNSISPCKLFYRAHAQPDLGEILRGAIVAGRRSRFSASANLPSTGTRPHVRRDLSSSCGGTVRTWDQAYRRWSPGRRIFQLFFTLLRRLRTPLRQVHRLASLVNIVGNDPRRRRNVAVPGPRSLIGMAILAGPIEGSFPAGAPSRSRRASATDRPWDCRGSPESTG